MQQLTLHPARVPAELLAWLRETEQTTLLVAIELDADGYVSLQALPDVDPQLVPRVRKTMAQYEETLRRLL
ncbi:MAG: hypothetical protein H0T53_08420 [Herpetosiphonaceae bacterium]|nr:hypothetical protein [Herpetosiphonaceae bacterium]